MDIEFEKLINNMPVTIFRCENDRHRTMRFISFGAETLTGYRYRDFIDNKVRTFDSIIFDADKEQLYETVSSCLDDYQHWELDYRIVTRFGVTRWVHETGVGHYDGYGKLLYIDGVLANVTENRNLEEELAQARKLESIGSLAAGLAHEINTPSQYIGDNLFFLKDAVNDLLELHNRYHETLERHSVATKMEELANDLQQLRIDLDFDYLRDETPKSLEQAIDGIARIRKIITAMKEFSHPGSKEKNLFDLNDSIESTVTVAVNEWKHVANVELDLSSDLPNIFGHGPEIGQVLLNILVNAAHAIADTEDVKTGNMGKINIRSERKGDIAHVEISDSGTGMPEEVKNKIFDPFFTTKEVGKGTGQGLSMAYKTIVDQHGGKLDVESTPGVGTTFSIQLPIGESQLLN